MEIARMQDVQHAGSGSFVARPFLEGNQSNVRIIRLASGQALPPHRHGASDLMLYVSDGQGELETAAGKVPFTAGSLASCGVAISIDMDAAFERIAQTPLVSVTSAGTNAAIRACAVAGEGLFVEALCRELGRPRLAVRFTAYDLLAEVMRRETEGVRD